MTRNIDRLLELMARLRDPDGGCPWDLEQTFATIVPHTIEEAYEVAEAVEANDMSAFKDELGDLLLQVVFYAQIAREDALFDFEDVAAAINDKLIRRHPHVFGNDNVEGSAAQTRAWEAQKAAERKAKAAENGVHEGEHSALDGVSVALPALSRAMKLQKRAARVGFDWDGARDVLDKFAEEIAEVTLEMDNDGGRERLVDEVGDLLFTCVNLARKLDIDPETALRQGNRKFERRFRRMEADLKATGERLENTTLAEKEAFWQRAKRR